MLDRLFGRNKDDNQEPTCAACGRTLLPGEWAQTVVADNGREADHLLALRPKRRGRPARFTAGRAVGRRRHARPRLRPPAAAATPAGPGVARRERRLLARAEGQGRGDRPAAGGAGARRSGAAGAARSGVALAAPAQGRGGHGLAGWPPRSKSRRPRWRRRPRPYRPSRAARRRSGRRMRRSRPSSSRSRFAEAGSASAVSGGAWPMARLRPGRKTKSRPASRFRRRSFRAAARPGRGSVLALRRAAPPDVR